MRVSHSALWSLAASTLVKRVKKETLMSLMFDPNASHLAKIPDDNEDDSDDDGETIELGFSTFVRLFSSTPRQTT